MRKFSFLLMVFSILACNRSSRPEKPDNLIPKEKMSKILYDVFILNAAKGTSKSVLEENGIFPETYVFEKYNIDSLQFAQSNNYYSYKVKTYEAIMAQVDTMINVDKRKYQARIDAEIEEKKLERDSIKKLSDSLKTPVLKKMKVENYQK